MHATTANPLASDRIRTIAHPLIRGITSSLTHGIESTGISVGDGAPTHAALPALAGRKAPCGEFAHSADGVEARAVRLPVAT